MNVSLYEISADFLKALDGLEVDEETGEITNFDAVEALNAQFEDKAESVACYIKNLTAFVADLKTEEAALPADYVTTTVTKNPDKTAIKKAIQGGQDVTGASLVEKRNIQIK